MMKLRLSHIAEQQLEDIWFYTLSEWGENQAIDYVGKLEQGIRQLLEHPYLGKARPEIQQELRGLPIQKHLIFYRVSDEFVDIIGILHSRVDVDSHFEPL